MPVHHVNRLFVQPRSSCERLPSQASIRAIVRCSTVLLLICAGVIGDGSLYAGCHYGRPGHSQAYRFKHAAHSADFNDQSSRGHARDFQFLGQWIYEAGEIKYVAWQSSAPCQGPNCHVNDDEDLPSTNAPAQRVVRPLLLSGVAATQRWDDSLTLVGHIDFLNTCGFAGYPHEHEYPP